MTVCQMVEDDAGIDLRVAGNRVTTCDAMLAGWGGRNFEKFRIGAIDGSVTISSKKSFGRIATRRAH